MKIFLVFLLFLAIIPLVEASVTVNPTLWSIELQPGSASTKVFEFVGSSNVSETVTLSDTGDTADWLSLNTTLLTVSSTKPKKALATLNIPSSASPGLHIGYIKWNNNDIPVILTIPSSTVGSCRLDPTPDSYATFIKQGTAPFSKRFNIQVTQGCTESVDIKTPLVIGVTETSTGPKPISLVGGTDLGLKPPLGEGYFDVQFDVSGLSIGTYTPSIQIYGFYKGNKITTTINFQVTVTGTASPFINATPPVYDVPARVTAGSNFEIRARQLNPNFLPMIIPNKDVVGIKTNLEDGVWTWTGVTNKTGTLTIEIATMYNGAQFGSVKTYNIEVVGGSYVGGSGNLTFEFFPSLNTLKDKDALNILVRDAGTRNIVNGVDLYLNGVKMSNSTISSVEANKNYCISAAHPSYKTLDKCFNITNKNYMNLFIQPDVIEQGTTVTILAKDTVTAEDVPNVKFELDGISVEKQFSATQTVGQHKIKATAPSYEPKSINFTILDRLAIVSAPEEIKKNKNVTITLNREVPWYITYLKNEKSSPVSYEQGLSNNVIFTPKKSGTYSVYANGQFIKTYEVGGIDLAFQWWYIPLIVMVFILIIIIFVSGSGRRKSKAGIGYPGGIGGDVVSPI